MEEEKSSRRNRDSDSHNDGESFKDHRHHLDERNSPRGDEKRARVNYIQSSGLLSLDALAKDKRALQMLKDPAKKIPLLNKTAVDVPDEPEEKNRHFDPRIEIDKIKLSRPKRINFHFVKWLKDPQMIQEEVDERVITKEKTRIQFQRREMIRFGVVHPPKPKLKIINLIKVLPSEATQGPTKLEMEITSAAAEREQAHINRNIARKLTLEERREKKQRKLFDDDRETIVSVYKINDDRFKVDINVLQNNRPTGCAVVSRGINNIVVVIKGSAKSIRRYGKIVLMRTDKCVLLWQGSVARRTFNRFFVEDCTTEAAAYKFFSDHGIAHYWDLADLRVPVELPV